MGPQPPKPRKWAADDIKRWKLDRIKPYSRNARLHSDTQVAQIAESMKRFGVTAPVLVDEDGVLIYGHGRLRAAHMLGLKELPVAVARGWTEDEKRAYRITDNQVALNSEWDLPTLKLELDELRLRNFEMPLLGFSEFDLAKYSSTEIGGGESDDGDDDEEDSRELTEEQKPIMIEAWKKLSAEWLAIVEKQETISTNHTKGAMAVHFLRARFHGMEIPSAATLAYTPHRAIVAYKSGSLADALRKASTNEDNFVERLLFAAQSVPRLDRMLANTLPLRDHRMPGEFPIDLARSLYDEFCPVGGKVLDPCHGWGGRMTGFLLSNAGEYHGFDTDPRTSKGVQALFDDLKVYADGEKRATLENKPFEESELEPESYDFALTSPPYFDTEKYGGENSSWQRYKTFQEWMDGFYRPLIERVTIALKPGAVFALQVGSQRFPLEEKGREIAKLCDLDYIETRLTEMSEKKHVGIHVEGAIERDREDHEVVVILQKKGGEPLVERDAAEEFGRVM